MTPHLDVSHVRMFKRPRFTMSEAILLNALVNADGNPQTANDLLRTLERVYPRTFRRERSTIITYMSQLRAKLGEESRNPRLIRSTTVEIDGQHVTAYYYSDAVLSTVNGLVGEPVPAGSHHA